jgi:hypothetical protein
LGVQPAGVPGLAPLRHHRKLRVQGLRGLGYRFFVGNLAEIKRLRPDATSATTVSSSQPRRDQAAPRERHQRHVGLRRHDFIPVDDGFLTDWRYDR